MWFSKATAVAAAAVALSMSHVHNLLYILPLYTYL